MRYVERLNIMVPTLNEPPGQFTKWRVGTHAWQNMVKHMRTVILADVEYSYLLSDQDVLNIFSYCHDYFGDQGAQMEYARHMMRVVAIEMLPGGTQDDSDTDYG